MVKMVHLCFVMDLCLVTLPPIRVRVRVRDRVMVRDRVRIRHKSVHIIILLS